MSRIAIIGAGVSGLAAGFQLSRSDFEVCVFEKSRGVSGRAASRSRNGCRYDHGANYLKPESNEVAELIFEALPHDDLSRIPGDIWTFDKDGKISPGDPKQNARSKWSYRSGISTLGKLLIDAGNLTVHRESLIQGLNREKNLWYLSTSSNEAHGPFDAVLLTPPAPQTVELLKKTKADPNIIAEMASVLGRVPYHIQFSVLLNFNGKFPLPGNAYALINSDRSHRVAWLSDEGQKADHVPADETLLVAQMNPSWSKARYDSPRSSIIETAHDSVYELLGGSLPSLHWADTQRWRYAHPEAAAAIEDTRAASEIGLFFAGDAFIGKGRVPGALKTGLAAADRIESCLQVT